jgi:iron complex transport system ATP-binding protein
MVMPARDAAAEAILEMQAVSVRYEGTDVEALREVTLTLSVGELVALVGPNGSGKTTLIRAVTGAVPLTSGSVGLAGQSLASMRAREVAKIVAVLPQEPALPAAFTALECVLMGRTPYLRLLERENAEDAEIARRAMVATDTWRLADRRVGELSGGERQRVVMARALAQETPVLLLDEPTAHLDLGHQSTVLGLARKAAREDGKAVLGVVHDLTLAGQCDRVVMLAEGRIVADGAPRDVITAETIARVYGLPAHVLRHPDSGLPVVAPSFEQG